MLRDNPSRNLRVPTVCVERYLVPTTEVKTSWVQETVLVVLLRVVRLSKVLYFDGNLSLL